MYRFFVTIVSLLFATYGVANAQEQALRAVENVEIINLDGDPAKLPLWGEKNLIVFYIDPDRAGQNKDFTDYLEESKRIESPNVFGMGVINLKDAPFIPNGLARVMADKRAARSGATVLADTKRTLSTAWGLGDCNNMFVVIVINLKGEIVYWHKGVLTKEDQDEFIRAVDTLR